MSVRRVGIAAAFLVAACARKERDAEDRPVPRRVSHGAVVLDAAARDALQISVVTASEGELPETRVRYGRVVARPGDEITIVAPVTARIASATSSIAGEHVDAGAVLVTLVPQLSTVERGALGVQAAEMRGQLEQAKQELALRKQELVRTRDLAKDGIAS